MTIFDLKQIVIIDMEVLSFDINENVLVQFSARKYNGNKMVNKLNILINTPLELTSNFVKRTRITDSLLEKKGITLFHAKEKIKKFINDLPLVSYKGNYFYFQLLWNIFNNDLKNPTIDVMDVAFDLKIINDNYDEISLEDLALSLNIKFSQNKWNNANYDVSIIEKIWFKLKSIYNSNVSQKKENNHG